MATTLGILFSTRQVSIAGGSLTRSVRSPSWSGRTSEMMSTDVPPTSSTPYT